MIYLLSKLILTRLTFTTMALLHSTQFVSGLYNPMSILLKIPPQVIRKFIPITIPVDWMKFVIGKKAQFFNAITYQSGTYYIWFHKSTEMIEILGPSNIHVTNAEQRLVNRMKRICVENLTKQGIWENDKPKMEIKKKVMWADIIDDE